MLMGCWLEFNTALVERENIEIVFPEADFAFDAFKSNHFVRYQIDYKVVKFCIDYYMYGLYRKYDGEGVGRGRKVQRYWFLIYLKIRLFKYRVEKYK